MLRELEYKVNGIRFTIVLPSATPLLKEMRRSISLSYIVLTPGRIRLPGEPPRTPSRKSFVSSPAKWLQRLKSPKPTMAKSEHCSDHRSSTSSAFMISDMQGEYR
ncbi:hypothetical protein BDZ89DRAFT_1056630 [Hymenopellis radicata]|nr:hypothetical protein BDZ89DRAFT_1056630 [Hymenopellis radicata]